MLWFTGMEMRFPTAGSMSALCFLLVRHPVAGSKQETPNFQASTSTLLVRLKMLEKMLLIRLWVILGPDFPSRVS